jgi:hypothetical protein
MSGTSGVFAQLVSLVGEAAIAWRRLQGTVREQAVGSAPNIPAARPQGQIPTLKMPTARGWAPGQTPAAAPGLRVQWPPGLNVASRRPVASMRVAPARYGNASTPSVLPT